MLDIKLLGFEHRANMLSLNTTLTPGVESKGQIFFFSENGHVAHQIKVKEV